MISSEVQRTLVKSPPELWAEISDPAALARHLGEFGEIRITRVDPEQRVEWEAGDTSGSVVIKPSGWGTKVKLTVTRELAADQTSQAEAATAAPAAGQASDADTAAAAPAAGQAIEAEPPAEPPAEDDASEAAATSEPGALSAPATHAGSTLAGTPQPWLEPVIDFEPADELAPEPELEPDSHLASESESESELAHGPELELEPRRGFFARLLGHLRGAPPELSPAQAEPAEVFASAEPGQEPSNAMSVWAALMAPEPGPEPVAEPVAEPEPVAELEPIAEHRSSPEEGFEQPFEAAMPSAESRPPDISAQLSAAEEIAADEVTTVLTGVLDRLGAAHHRPFSRS